MGITRVTLLSLPDLLQRVGAPRKGPVGFMAGDEVLVVPDRIEFEVATNALRRFLGGFDQLATRRRVASVLRGELDDPAPYPAITFVNDLPSDRCAAYRGKELVGVYDARGGRGRLAAVEAIGEQAVRLDAVHEVVFCLSESRSPEPAIAGAPGSLDRPVLRSVTAGVDRAMTRARSLSEAAERHLLSDISSQELVRCAASELPGAYLRPDVVATHSRGQVARHRLEPWEIDSPEWWVRGVDLETAQSTFVPAALVLAPFELPKWTTPGMQNSNGAAFGRTKERAIQHAWCELVERDAFLRFWRMGAVLHLLDRRGWTPLLISVSQWIERRFPEATVAAGIIEGAHGIPVALFAAFGPGLGVAIGTSAGSPDTRLEKAALECMTQSLWYPADLELAEGVRSPTDHRAFYRFGSRYLDFAGAVADRSRPSDREWPQPRIPERGVVVELGTLPELEGVAVKVVDPNLVAMTFGYDTEPVMHYFAGDAHQWEIENVDSPLTPHPFA